MPDQIHIRAKYRVLQSIHGVNGHITKLGPVLPASGEHTEENKQFWDATPSGECVIHHTPGVEPMPWGEFFYIDMVRNDEGRWTGHVKDNGESGEVEFWAGWQEKSQDGIQHGKLTIGIGYEATLLRFGRGGRQWTITFTLA